MQTGRVGALIANVNAHKAQLTLASSNEAVFLFLFGGLSDGVKL